MYKLGAILFGLVLSASMSSHADFVLFDQAPQEVIDNSNTGLISDIVVPTGHPYTFQTFDDFVLPKESVVNSVFWVGSRVNGNSEAYFQISFHEDDPSAYRRPIEIPFASYYVTAEEFYPLENAPVFSAGFRAELPEGVNIESGKTYWISVALAATERENYWAWGWRTERGECCARSIRFEDSRWILQGSQPIFSLSGLYHVPALADTDGDLIYDEYDNCPDTPAGLEVNVDGCALFQLDEDQDGVFSDVDQCPNTVPGISVDILGCDPTQLDSDEDGVWDAYDDCPSSLPGEHVDVDGCVI